MNTTAEFGYNTDLEHDNFTTSERLGTKYNFNINGKVLGVFSSKDQCFLLSQVTSSFGDDCMVGTIDAREVTIRDEESSFSLLLSNNELSAESMQISMMLSGKDTSEELNAGIPIEQTTRFENLAKLGIALERQDMRFGERMLVCGIEKAKFDKYKAATRGSKKI